MTRQINLAGLNLIKSFESLQLTAYDDGGGVWTIGWGHTQGVRPGQSITAAQADDLLRQDLATAENAVSSLVKVHLTDNQFAALVSYCYNRGAGNFARSDVLSLLNQSKYAEASQAIANFIAPNPKFRKGITRRRKAEAALFNQT